MDNNLLLVGWNIEVKKTTLDSTKLKKNNYSFFCYNYEYTTSNGKVNN